AVIAQRLGGRFLDGGGRVVIRQEALLAAGQPGGQHDRALGGPRRLQPVEEFGGHPTFSTNTFSLPPQARPTSHARSSVTPKSSSWGAPVCIVCWATSATAPSMQPPLTEPAMRPLAVTAIWLPGGRGELPQVSVTVASATVSPSASHCRAVLSTSSASSITASKGRRRARW